MPLSMSSMRNHGAKISRGNWSDMLSFLKRVKREERGVKSNVSPLRGERPIGVRDVYPRLTSGVNRCQALQARSRRL